jgi:hypothetical protein
MHQHIEHTAWPQAAQPVNQRVASRRHSPLFARLKLRLAQRHTAPAPAAEARSCPAHTDADLNRIQLTGTLASEPLLVDVGDHPVALLALACTRHWVDPSGKLQREITWLNLRAWEGLAEQCGRLLHRGDRVYLEGTLQLWSEQRGGASSLCHAVDLDRIVLLAAGPGAVPVEQGR